MLSQTFKSIQHVITLYEGHFAVHLGKLGLTVSTKVFIPETLYNLEVTVITGNHQQLFEHLWGLWQSIKLTGVNTRRHNEVTCTFRS